MTKTILLSGAVLAFATSAFAAAPKPAAKPAKGAAPAEVHCAVMTSHKVNVKEATAKKAYTDYKGNRYFFCCAGCEPEFKKDPAKFAKSDHIPTPKDAK